jgi:hypothetical protein
MAATFSLTGFIRLLPRWEEPIGPALLADTTTFLQTLSIANGTGAGQANAYWRDVRTVAASTNDTIDYEDLPLSVMGATGSLSIASLRLVYIRNRSTTKPLRFLFDPSDLGGSDYADIGASGTLFWSGSGALSQATDTAHSFVIRNADATASVDYEILIVGVKS